MDLARLALELTEKASLVASAALLAVWFRPLRKRLLGIGGRADKVLAMLLGLLLSVWGAHLGFRWVGQEVDLRGIGVLIAAVLGGRKAGFGAGLFAGVYYGLLVGPRDAPWVLLASLVDGTVVGLLAHRRPGHLVHGGRAFLTAVGVQLLHVGLVAAGIGLLRGPHAMLEQAAAWPAHLVELLANAGGLALFTAVARLALAREEAVAEAARARADAEATRLEALQRSMEPHFLFNALNALRATVRRDPERARELLADLADLYRYVLAHRDEATLGEEADHALAFLAIERVRLGEQRLRVDLDVPGELREARLPALLLQPLVENAVKHGVAARPGPGTVYIEARREGAWLLLRVEDRSERGVEREQAAADGLGMGLRTLRERLRRRYAEDVGPSLQFEPTGTVVTLRFPWAEVAPPHVPAGAEAPEDGS